MCKGLSRSFKDRSFHLNSPMFETIIESLKEKSWIERPGKWSKGPCPKAAKPFPATWKRRACSGNSNGRLSFG